MTIYWFVAQGTSEDSERYRIDPGKSLGLIYRVSHQYGNTFNFNYLILYQCYSKSKTSSEKLRFKPSRGHLDFDFFQKIRLFFRVGTKRNKNEIFFDAMPPPSPFFKMSQDFVFSDSCTRDILKKGGGMAPKKISFLPTQKNNQIF